MHSSCIILLNCLQRLLGVVDTVNSVKYDPNAFAMEYSTFLKIYNSQINDYILLHNLKSWLIEQSKRAVTFTAEINSFHKHHQKSPLCAVVDSALDIFLHLIDCDDVVTSSHRMVDWYLELFSIPFIVLLCSSHRLIKLLASPQFNQFIQCFIDVTLQASISKQDSQFHSFLNCSVRPNLSISLSSILCGHWFLGNFAYIGPLLLSREYLDLIRTSVSDKATSVIDTIFPQLLSNYLKICLYAINEFPLTDLYRGRNVTLWSSNASNTSTTMTAAAIPLLLQNQLLVNGFFNVDFMKALLKYSVAPIYLHYPSGLLSSVSSNSKFYIHVQSDFNEVKSSLEKSNATDSNGISIAQDNIKSQQALDLVTYSSRWAQRLLFTFKSSSKSGSVNVSSLQSPVTNTASEISTKESEVNKLMNLSSDDTLVLSHINHNLIVVVLELWGTLLPLASLSNTDSFAFKSISAFAFHPFTLPLLWKSLEYFLSQLYQQKSYQLEQFLSSQLTNNGIEKPKASKSLFSSLFSSKASKSKEVFEISNRLPVENVGMLGLEHYSVTYFKTSYCSLNSSMTSSSLTGQYKSESVSAVLYANICCLTSVLKIMLMTVDDDELYVKGRPFQLHEMLPLIRGIKIILMRLLRYSCVINSKNSTLISQLDDLPTNAGNIGFSVSSISENLSNFVSNLFQSSNSSSTTTASIDTANKSNVASNNQLNVPLDEIQLFSVIRCVASVLTDLHTRWSRTPFTRDHQIWELSRTSSSISSLLPMGDVNELLGLTEEELENHQYNAVTMSVFRLIPWIIPFHTRLKLVRKVISTERESIQTESSNEYPLHSLNTNRSKGTVVRIRRRYLIEDGMSAFSQLKSINYTSGFNDDKVFKGSIKDRIVVRYIDATGEEEKGIDVGGLFKDFLTDLSSRVFNPNYGLFIPNSKGYLYPNPVSTALYSDANASSNFDDLSKLYYFLGQVLGKAIYEDITIQPQFAHFFLSFMHGKYSFLHIFDDLTTLDFELFKNLKFLKFYEVIYYHASYLSVK